MGRFDQSRISEPKKRREARRKISNE